MTFAIDTLLNSALSAIKKIPGINGVDRNAEGIIIRTETNIDVRPKIFQAAVEAGWIIIEMKKEEVSVEHIFQKLTKEHTYA